MSAIRCNSIVSHVARSSAEFSVRFDDFVDSFQEIFLCRHLSAGADSKHTGFRAHRSDFGTCRREEMNFDSYAVELDEVSYQCCWDKGGPAVRNGCLARRSSIVRES